MRLKGTIWLREVVDKLAFKHGVETNEVEEILNNKPKVRLVERGKRKGEDVYQATGQTDAGRYLLVIFILKATNKALILTARDMTGAERKRHAKR
jgi:uncharacterized DUF497 family protein